MKSLDAATLAALAGRVVMLRHYLTVTAYDRDSGSPSTYRFWTGAGDVSHDIVDALTGATSAQTFRGGNRIVEIGPIVLANDLSIRPVEISLDILDATVADLVRAKDPRQGPVQIHRGVFAPDSNRPVAAARALFAGFVDKTPIETAAVGGESRVTLVCVPHIREMTRASTEKRSNNDQKDRSATDDFFKDVGVVGRWIQFWGRDGRGTAGGSKKK